MYSIVTPRIIPNGLYSSCMTSSMMRLTSFSSLWFQRTSAASASNKFRVVVEWHQRPSQSSLHTRRRLSSTMTSTAITDHSLQRFHNPWDVESVEPLDFDIKLDRRTRYLLQLLSDLRNFGLRSKSSYETVVATTPFGCLYQILI